MRWIFVSSPQLPVEDIQQWCLDFLPEEIDPKSWNPIDTLNKYANDIYFDGNGEKFQISYYVKWEECLSCGSVPEVHHPFIDGKKSKELPFCDDCSSKLYGEKFKNKIKSNKTQQKDFTKKIKKKIKKNEQYESYIDEYGTYSIAAELSRKSAELFEKRKNCKKEDIANYLIRQLSV